MVVYAMHRLSEEALQVVNASMNINTYMYTCTYVPAWFPHPYAHAYTSCVLELSAASCSARGLRTDPRIRTMGTCQTHGGHVHGHPYEAELTVKLPTGDWNGGAMSTSDSSAVAHTMQLRNLRAIIAHTCTRAP